MTLKFHLMMLRSLIRAWFGLTTSERAALLLIISLAILGLVVRSWHLRHRQAGTYVPPLVEKTSPAPHN